jgi:hypothetical protein
MKQNRIKGVAFTINSTELKNLDIMPPNASVINLTSVYGSKHVIYYPLKYPPASWHSWQLIGSIYLQIQKIFPSAEFNYVERTGTYEYTLQEFASYFNNNMRFPTPYYPKSKSEYMSRLAIYAKKLYFDSMLNFELVVAMALHFNALTECGYSYREVFKKANAIMKLDRSTWKKRVGKPSTKKAIEARQRNKENKKQIVLEHLPMYVKSNGKYDFEALSLYLGISTRSLRRYAKELSASDHITQPNGKNSANPLNTEVSEKKCLPCNIRSQMAKNEVQNVTV